MTIRDWRLPIQADRHRSIEVTSLTFGRSGLVLRLREEDRPKEWELRFPEVQAFKCTSEESAGPILGSLPSGGAFFEVLDSPWLDELGRGKLEYMSHSKHWVVCCYDEVVEIAAPDYALEPG